MKPMRMLPVLAVIAVTWGTSARSQEQPVVTVNNVEELYAAVNDPANAGALLVLASGEFMLTMSDPMGNPRPNAGRLVLQSGMSIEGQNSYAESEGVPVPIGIDPATGDRIFATNESIIEGNALTGPRAMIEAGLNNAIRNVTLRGGENPSAEIALNLRPASGPANVEVTECILEKGRRGIGTGSGGVVPGGTVDLRAQRNIFRHHGVTSARFSWGIQLTATTGARVSAEIRDSLFYDNKVALFLPSLGAQDGETQVLSSHNVYELQRFDAGVSFSDKVAAGIFIFIRDFFNPLGSHRNRIQLISTDDAIWNNDGTAGLGITGIQRDTAGVEIEDNEIDVLLEDTRFVKVRDGAFDGPQNRDAILNKRRDIAIVGEVATGTGPTSGNKVNVELRNAKSSLMPTSYDPDPHPLLVDDNAPADVAITVTGGLTFDEN